MCSSNILEERKYKYSNCKDIVMSAGKNYDVSNLAMFTVKLFSENLITAGTF